MKISIKTSKWYEDICAAFLIFTKLPIGKLFRLNQNSYSNAIAYWPLTGWITASLMAAVLYFADIFMPYQFAVILAITARILFTGGIYEQGMRRFISQVTGRNIYGNAALLLYLLLLYLSISTLNTESAVILIFAADPFAKMISGQTIQMLPHAPIRDDIMPQIIFQKFSTIAGIVMFLFGILPILLFFYLANGIRWDLVIFVPCIVMYFQYLLFLRTQHGYSKESLCMMFLINELTVYLVVTLQTIL